MSFLTKNIKTGKPRKIIIDSRYRNGSKIKNVVPTEKISLKTKVPNKSRLSLFSLIKKIKRGIKKTKPKG